MESPSVPFDILRAYVPPSPLVPLNRGWSYREQVGPDAAGRSVLAYLTATRPHSTEAEWAARIERGEVEVEGTRVRARRASFTPARP